MDLSVILKSEGMNTLTRSTKKAGELSRINSFFYYIRDLPFPQKARISLVSCLDLSAFQESMPGGMEYELLSSPGGNAEKDLLWRDLEDELPLDSKVYDLILVIDWLEYCSWPRWALQKIFNLLKDSGQLVLFVENAESSFFRSRKEESWKKQTGPFCTPAVEEPPPHADFHTIKKTCYAPVQYPAHCIQSWLYGAGFTIDQIQQYNAKGQRLSEPVPSGMGKSRGLLRKWIGRWNLSKGQTWILYHGRKQKSRSDQFREQTSSRPDFLMLFEKRYAGLTEGLEQWLDIYPQFRTDYAAALEPPKKKTTVLVLSPHPDDEVIGGGGLLVHLAQTGSRVVVLQLTDGSQCHSLWNKPDPYRSGIRAEEARQAANAMGAECLCWQVPEGELRCSRQYLEKLHSLLADLQPEWILVPFINDPHPDHRACNELLQAVLRQGRINQALIKILHYEVSSFLPANVYFRIDMLMDRKEQLLLFYQNGMKPVDYVDFCLWRHAYCSRLYTQKPGFVETFQMLSPEEYLSVEPVTTSHERIC